MSAPCPALGFVVDLEPAAGLSIDRLAKLRAEWAAFLDGRGLRGREQAGGAQVRFEVESEASQATQNDRAAAESWLSARAELKQWRVGASRISAPIRELGTDARAELRGCV